MKIDELNLKKEYIEQYISDWKKKNWKSLFACKYNETMDELWKLANMLYMYNQNYTDYELEKMLRILVKKIRCLKCNISIDIINTNRDVVVFYDCFGLDIRGLACIYLEALKKLGYFVVYVTYESAKGNIPTLDRILNADNCRQIFIPNGTSIMKYSVLVECLKQIKPQYAFLYTYPNDIVGIMAFMKFEGQVKRFQINLTDHAFWLGVNAFDYCLEFRPYGATISTKYRGVSQDKLLYQPFYPFVDYSVEFAGFPFEKKKDDFVVFSGGSLYKTIDSEGTYYQLIRKILRKYKNVKFWYAGYGGEYDRQYIVKLVNEFPEQAYWTHERKDLFKILENIDIYFNTYPLGGGLMTQYAAAAGKIPLSLVGNDSFISDFLLNQEQCGIEYNSVELFLNEFDRLILDKKYLQKKERLLHNAVVTEKLFADNLRMIMEKNKSMFMLKSINLNLTEFWDNYAERFIRENVKD